VFLTPGVGVLKIIFTTQIGIISDFEVLHIWHWVSCSLLKYAHWQQLIN